MGDGALSNTFWKPGQVVPVAARTRERIDALVESRGVVVQSQGFVVCRSCVLYWRWNRLGWIYV